MKNHELLDLIGEVNEDYVQAANAGAARPRPRWQALAACAACAALVLGACVWRASLPGSAADGPEGGPPATACLVQRPGLHDYTLVEGAGHIMTTQGDAALGVLQPIPEPFQPSRGSGPSHPGGTHGDDVPMQEGAWYYDLLMQGMGVPSDGSPAAYPDWFGGAWVEGGQGELLAVGIVEQDRTPGLEAQIRDWTSQDVVLYSVKYSQNYLDGLMDGITRIFEEMDVRISHVYGVYVMENYLDLAFYGGIPSDEVLAALAELDPAGDAIRVQVFAGGHLTYTIEPAEDPAPIEPGKDPGGAAQPAPGTAQQKGAARETAQPAANGLPTGDTAEPRQEK